MGRNIFFIVILSSFLWSNIGYVNDLKGKANLLRNMKTLKVKKGMSLQVKDKIVTKENSRVQAILKDKTVVTIGAASTFTFDTYTFAGKNNSQLNMHIDHGFFRTVSGKIGKLAPERFKVKTVLATIGIRGTDFSANVSEKREVIACHRGEISVLTDKKSYIVPEGEEIILERGSSILDTNSIIMPYIGLGSVYNRIYSTNSAWFDNTTPTQDQTAGISTIIGLQFNDYIAIEGRLIKTIFEKDYSDLTAYSIFLKPQYPINKNFKIYGLLGFGTTDVKGNAKSDGYGAHDDVIGKKILHHTGLQWGIGFSYGITENISFFTDYTSLAKDEDIDSTLYGYDPVTYHKLSTDGITVGILYSF